MKPIFPIAILAIATLSACSERDMCLSNIDSEVSTLTRLSNEARDNIERGYAISTAEHVRERKYTCMVTQADGSEVQQICTDVDTVKERIPVAIDMVAERAKYAQLQQRLAQETRRTQAARAQCYATYPE